MKFLIDKKPIYPPSKKVTLSRETGTLPLAPTTRHKLTAQEDFSPNMNSCACQKVPLSFLGKEVLSKLKVTICLKEALGMFKPPCVHLSYMHEGK